MNSEVESPQGTITRSARGILLSVLNLKLQSVREIKSVFPVFETKVCKSEMSQIGGHVSGSALKED